ncbi:MAG: hypothetical protein U5O39_01785 [Gammaproteobacteria bacterium]|nr:hypothetical protein [Gammaproteobacteria bacterium]
MPQLSVGKKPYGLPQVVETDLDDLNLDAPQASGSIIDSLAEQVPLPVRGMLDTRESPKLGNGSPSSAEKPTALVRNGIGSSSWPVTGLTVGCLSLNFVSSNVLPAIWFSPAIMKATSFAIARNPPPL